MKILIVFEEERDFSKIEEVFLRYGVTCTIMDDKIFKNVDGNFDFSEFTSMIYQGNSPDLTRKAMAVTRLANFKKVVYIGSTLAYFDRTYPDYELSKHQFVKNAVECEDKALGFSKNMNVSVLEIPFYKLPNEFPTVDGVVGMKMGKWYFVPDGGMGVLSDESFANAMLAVLVNGKSGIVYPMCDGVKKYKEILTQKIENKKVYEYPEEFLKYKARAKIRELKKNKKKAMFDIKKLYTTDLLKNFYFDATPVKEVLEYEKLGLVDKVKEEE